MMGYECKGPLAGMQAPAQTKLILVVDDEDAVARALARRCEQLGVQVRKAHNAVEAMSILNQGQELPDLMIVDYHMPGADGLTLCDMLRTNDALSSLPAILLTGYDNEQTRRRCEQVGAHFVRKDVEAWNQLEPLIRRLLGLAAGDPGSPVPTQRSPAGPERAALQTEKGGKKVLVIDDDPMISKGLRVRLETLGYRVCYALTGRTGYYAALKERPNLIVLDYKMPEGWGNTILGNLKSDPATRDVPVIILSGMTDVGVQRDILRMGAERWVNKPFEMKDFIKIIQDRIGPA